jgi:uncharacterized protein (DUF983 family)
MITVTHENKRKSIVNLFACKCPRCREGDMFENRNPYVLKETMKMNTHCKVCGQPLNIEVGFYYGSSYISYAFSIAVSAATFVLWWWGIGFSLYDNRIFYWLAFNAITLVALQPYLMRVARTGWLAIFVRYDRNWNIHEIKVPERINETQEKNW